MFDPADRPRVFALPPGADFPARLADGILSRMKDASPEALARVTVLVNTRRMQRRLKSLLARDGARLLPRIGLVTDIDALLPAANLPPPVTPLRRRLELTRLVAALIERQPDIAPRSAAVDLADSLAGLMDEMQGEGVSRETVETLDISDQSGHWARSLQFLSIVGRYSEETADRWIDAEARRRLAAEQLIETWQADPPQAPIIIAGSTGSRATTALLMEAVANLPQGAVVLPGFDFHMTDEVWRDLSDSSISPLGAEDHPQFRFAAFLDRLELSTSDVPIWSGSDERAERNALVSLSLSPAPVTHRWLSEGPRLGDLRARTTGLTLMEAQHPKIEALAIAVALREGVERGKTVALITPDRTLGRRVAAALKRWGIEPDDSAGRPLSLTAPGRFLRQVAGLIGVPAAPVDLVALLKHPLTFTGTERHGDHLRLTREFELHLRKTGVAQVEESVITEFANERTHSEGEWCQWLSGWLAQARAMPQPTLAAALSHHLSCAEQLASGGAGGAGELWERSAGRDVLVVITKFKAEGDFDSTLLFSEYMRLLERALTSENTRSHDTARPDVMIWGTLEARVQGADLVVLGGLNEDTWPERPQADPWLNRALRRQAGLLLPERQIGLAAHDYQQAVAAEEVILSRARRDTEKETVASRWVSRLTNLLDGLKAQNGPQALAEMRARGQTCLDWAAQIDLPTVQSEPEPRPDPAPPLDVRPRDYTVTEIQTLIRDPYAIYARHVLGLRPLDPLHLIPDARLKGEVFHDIAEEVFSLDSDFSDIDAAIDRLRLIARAHLDRLPWPGVRAHWTGHIDAIAAQLASDEQLRRQSARPVALERKGRIDLPGTPFSIRGKADRIDRLPDGRLAIYDYKTGGPPTADQIRHYDRQLPIEAVMAEAGGFEDLAAAEVAYVEHIGMGRTPNSNRIALVESSDTDFRTVTIKGELVALLTSFHSETKGYPARRAMQELRYSGDYDHLSRFGEWDETSTPKPERLP